MQLLWEVIAYLPYIHKLNSLTYEFTSYSAYEAKFFISLFERSFKMMKNGVYFIVMALLVAELFKILIYAN